MTYETFDALRVFEQAENNERVIDHGTNVQFYVISFDLPVSCA